MSRAAEESGLEPGHMVQPPQVLHQRNQAAEGDAALQDVGRDSARGTLFLNVFIPFSRGETQLNRVTYRCTDWPSWSCDQNTKLESVAGVKHCPL